MSPFDWRSALLAKHAQHVVLVHFPIALGVTSWAFDLVAWWRSSVALATVAYYNLATAAVLSVPTLATGLLAWQWQLEGARLKGNLRLHLIFAITGSAMLWILCWLRVRHRRTALLPDKTSLMLATLTVIVIALTGHLGGYVSGVNIANN